MTINSPAARRLAGLVKRCSPSPNAASRGFVRVLAGFALLTGLALAPGSGVAPAAAAAPPTLDGNIDDVIAFLQDGADCGLEADDPAQDVCKTDAGLIPCAPEVACPLGGGATIFTNGYDFTRYVVAYQAAGGNLWLGFRVTGQIGDSNGDGDPGNVCAIPGANIADPGQIALSEQYLWEIDTNCDGTPDILIEVRGDQVNVIGTGFTSKDFMFNGTDLEVHVSGVTLPVVWRVRPFVGSTTDGLSEDTATPRQCPPPNLDLEIDKEASVTELCPGEVTRFTIDVTNTGDADLMVDLTDQLPAGLLYSGNLSGDFSFQSEVAGLITFNTLAIPKGQTRSVSFDATADQQCFGELTNVATATGTFDEPCLEEPMGVGPVQAEAMVTCKDPPTVDLEVLCPEAACEGDQILLSATATNTAQDPADITITIAGADTTFLNVAPGGEVTWERYVEHGPCVEGFASYDFAAQASNACGDSDIATDDCSVACSPEPCVSDLSGDGPEAICTGDDVEIDVSARNCSDGPATVVLRAGNQAKVFENVGANELVGHTFFFEEVECTVGQQVVFPISAVVSTVCDSTGAQSTVNVDCNPEPCVEITDASGPESICTGDDAEICAEAQNCTQGPATIVIRIGDQAKVFENVEPGATVEFCAVFEDQACSVGQNLSYPISATAITVCDSMTVETNVDVACNPEPCVEITDASGPSAICSGDDVEICVEAQNCTQGPATIVIRIGDHPKVFENVASGATVEYCWTYEEQECVEGENLNFPISATAITVCDSTTVESSVQVGCNPEPCVEVVLEGPESACAGTLIELCATATNCSDGIEDITVWIGEFAKTVEGVEPGGTVELCVNVTMPECVENDQVPFSARAEASNSCGEIADSDDTTVRCDEPHVDVEKEASVSEAFEGDTYTYTITVRNTGTVLLENLVVTDDICDYVSYAGNANPAPSSAPIVGTPNGTIEWMIPELAAGGQMVFTFDVTVEQCGQPCVNYVSVEGYCGPSSRAFDEDQITTDLLCRVVNCPHTVGFWAQQCKAIPGEPARANVKYPYEDVVKIAEKVDELSSYFNWADGTDFSNFCSIITPPKPMNIEKQLKRQFAGLLANMATGQLGLIAWNGQEVSLDPSTPINCGGSSTIGELIAKIDAALTAGDWGAYGSLKDCADAINNGQGIGQTCYGAKETEDRSTTVGGDTDLRSTGGLGDGTTTDIDALGEGVQPLLELYSPAPNPFRNTTRVAYAVGGNGESVEISVFDVSGRKVRTLVSGYSAPGRFEVTWDGRTDGGVQVTPGVYFLRAFVGGQRVSAAPRMLYIR